jgi:hypothetical protein
MLMLEDKRKIKGYNYAGLMTIETCVGFLTEKFGSGKTIMILSLILQCPIPIHTHVIQTIYKYRSRKYNPAFFIKKKFNESNMIKPNLIFTGSSVLLQWEEAIRKFTNLKYMTVKNYYGLKKLINFISNGDINQYDIILAKNGSVSGNLNIPNLEKCNETKTKKIYNVIGNITRNKCWSRLIVDDYDIIKLPTVSIFINANFTWYVSATNYEKKVKNVSHYNEGNMTITKTLSRDMLHIHSISARPILKNIFNICNDPKYTELSVKVGKPKFWLYELENKNSKYADMISSMMSTDDAKQIMEMFNADAIETAAGLAGIKTNSIADIFKKLLQDKYDEYKLAVDTLGFIDGINLDELESLPEPEKDDVYHQKHVYQKREIKYAYPNILEKILAVKGKCKTSKLENGKAIERIKDNIKSGDCPICECEFEGDDAIILKCCDTLMCADCGIAGTYLRRTNNIIKGKCPNCRRRIDLNHFVFLNSEFDLSQIDESNLKEVKEGKTENKEEVKYKTKTDILLAIIKGKNVPRIQKKVSIPGMIEGLNELPASDKKKFIIFSKFEESLENFSQIMERENISFKRLGGTTSNIYELSKEFNESFEGNNILLANGEKYSSGVNFESATDFIFVHKIMDPDIEAQCIGRLQRLGRKYEANIHYILYKEEVSFMNFTK